MKESNDILTLFEALNNHEIFTPPRLARDMLAMVPKEIWCDPNIRVLDPCTKSGVFLREVMYLLFEGLLGKGLYKASDGVAYDLNDPKQVITHILKNMLYGIATSELTGYVSRRTLYGVMKANTDKQTALIEAFEKSKNNDEWTEDEKVSFLIRNRFNDYYDHKMFNTPNYKGYEDEGNIFYPAKNVQKKILEEGNYEIEDTYYPFIEDNIKHSKIDQIRNGKMKFDVIIGNPPYQVSDGGGVGSSAIPIYQKFIEHAFSLNPRYVSMITPSRWFTGGRGLDAFRERMLKDKRIKIIHDFDDARDCFPGVEIKGGVNYFLWDKNHSDDCEFNSHSKTQTSVLTRPLLEKGLDIFVRLNESNQILQKVNLHVDVTKDNFSSIVSANDPFGFDVRVKGSYKRVKPVFSMSKKNGDIEFYYNGWRKNGKGYLPPQSVRKNNSMINSTKILIPKAWGTGDSSKDFLSPFILEKPSCCTETYLVVGPFNSTDEANNVLSYMQTKFFHFMVSLVKNTQNTMQKAYSLVPIQDFSMLWSDDLLYKKYQLSQREIDYIENAIPESARG